VDRHRAVVEGDRIHPDSLHPVVIDTPGFPVEIVNTLGAGDAFASGLIYGYTGNCNWYRAARMRNANGAMLVTRHGCSKFMGYEEQVLDFITARGGF
jgi:5-dehydro-2-deoxygluconokinase